MKTKEQQIQAIKNKNDEYLQTIYAIIGFVNTYKFELKDSDDVLMFQGRKLYLDDGKQTFVTPDLGVVIAEKSGLIGEVKYGFPANQEHWQEIFEQISRYANIVCGWPTPDGKVEDYDVVLLLHQSRARRVVDYYINSLPEELKLKRTFVIIEFNYSSQGKEYFNFRIEHGQLSNRRIHTKLYDGLQVPFSIYVNQYSKVRINDVQPHLSFMLHLLYECMLDKSKSEGTYKKLTKRSKIIINTSIIEITHLLRETYSFKSLQSKTYLDGQPEFPKQEWVKGAVDKLIQIAEASWIDVSKGEFAYYLTSKEDNILDYYINKCLDEPMRQISLFDETQIDKALR